MLATPANGLWTPLPPEVVQSDAGMEVRWANGTPGTGILGSTQQTFSNTSGILIVENLAPAGSLQTVSPKWFRMIVTAADAAATAAHVYGTVDSILRYSAGGFSPIAPDVGFTRSDLGAATPIAKIVVGNLTFTSPSATKQNINRMLVKQATAAPCLLAGDIIEFVFRDPPGDAGNVTQSTTPGKYTVYLGAVSVRAQGSYTLHWWQPAVTTGVTFECDGAHLEG